MMRVALFDYGAGNLHSLAKALAGPARGIRLETDPRAALDTDVLVLPGVGAFAPAVARLAPAREAMRDAILGGLPTVGICLGMQLLFDGSDEGAGAGLGVIPGRVTKLRAARTPQIGWNALEDVRDPLFASSGLGMAYFANSFVCRPDDPAAVTAWSTHEQDRFAATVRVGRCIGVQFHPEKSSAPGVRFLDGFLRSVSVHGAASLPRTD
jgi:glutamine amidotransferase